MRTAGLPNFRKLFGSIQGPLLPGKYTLQIYNAYDTSAFEGKKSFVLSTTNALGGQNYFLATCYLVVGALSVLSSIVFFGLYWRTAKKANATGDKR
jgi:hypothetical protein